MSLTLKNIELTYSFATQGGAVGTILYPIYLPANATITRLLYVSSINPTSATSAAVAQFYLGPEEIGASWGPGGDEGGSNNYVTDLWADGNNPFQSAPLQVKLVITVEALTAGQVNFILEYY